MTPNQEPKKKPGLPVGNPKNNNNIQLFIVLAIVLGIFAMQLFSGNSASSEINMKRFKELYLKHDIDKIVIVNKEMVEVFLNKEALESDRHKDAAKSVSPFGGTSPAYYMPIADGAHFQAQLEKFENDNNIKSDERVAVDIDNNRTDLGNQLMSIGILVLIVFSFWYFMRRMASGGGPGGQIFNIGKSRAQLFEADNKVKITFADVAGLDEAKEEIKEIVEFLKTPGKFTNLGGKIPKGALLVGPPGTGKTLLAKAVAGEAGVPFFSLSGSDFVEMFVGVGAARVRDLFKQAKEKAPCIIFIDEIDAIGRSRGRGAMPGANDERENTLNSLLVEMDGFATDSGVIILAATNRPDVLDSALMRPGRFDRQISIDKPDIVGREQIFRVHLKVLKLNEDVDPKKLSAQTPGFAGAEIANVCNEAALIAARKNHTSVDMSDFQDAVDRVIGGLEKKSKIISPDEKKIVAYHEAGHAVAGWYLEHADPLVKVSIVPRGIAALGYAQYLPKEQFLYTQEQLTDEMCLALGGRAAEDLVFGRVSTGALSDLERITKMAYGMVTIYGFNDKIGNVSFYDSKGSEYNFNKPYSEATAQTIDEEVRLIITNAYIRTQELLKSKEAELEIVAQELLKKEIIYQYDLEKLIGPRPFEKQTTYQAFIDKPSDEVEPKIEAHTDTSLIEINDNPENKDA